MNDYIDPETHRINGSRITIYDVLDYTEANWPVERIMQYLPITPEQIQVALEFVAAHKAEVMAEYQEMLDRAKRGNPPEVEAKLAITRSKIRAIMAERRAHAENCV